MTTPDQENKEVWLKMLEIQWQDHFQTRIQTWKSLEISAILTIALIGSVWQLDNPVITIVGGALLGIIAISGCQITFWHRKAEQTKFRKISELEKLLGLEDPKLQPPRSINLFSVIKFNQSNTSLFILRMHFIILLFAIGHVVWGIYTHFD